MSKVLITLRKWAPVVNLVLGIGLFLIAVFLSPKIAEWTKSKEEIITPIFLSVFIILYIFLLTKLKFVQHNGFKKSGIIETIALLSPFFIVEAVYCGFLLFSAQRNNIAMGWDFLKTTFPSFLTMFLVDFFRCEIVYFGFLSAVQHRVSKTQWRAVLGILLAAAIYIIFFYFTNVSNSPINVFTFVIPIILGIVWVKGRNQIMFPMYLITSSLHTLMVSMTDYYGAEYWNQDRVLAKQLGIIFIVEVVLFIAYALFLIFTIKFPIIRRKAYYSREVTTASGQTQSEVRSVVVTKDGVKDEYVGELDTKTEQ